MKNILASLLSASLLLGHASAQTTQNRAVLYALNNGNIYTNNSGAVTPQNINTVIAAVIASTANLNDVNTFTYSQGFSGTKTVGSCVMTISNGIISNVTGC